MASLFLSKGEKMIIVIILLLILTAGFICAWRSIDIEKVSCKHKYVKVKEISLSELALKGVKDATTKELENYSPEEVRGAIGESFPKIEIVEYINGEYKMKFRTININYWHIFYEDFRKKRDTPLCYSDYVCCECGQNKLEIRKKRTEILKTLMPSIIKRLNNSVREWREEQKRNKEKEAKNKESYKFLKEQEKEIALAFYEDEG
ncbi:MAG: hypothetical protein GY679_01665 [Mycoplasma sp.]|nr:hypothetical protein [Mycoplasma sp.]